MGLIGVLNEAEAEKKYMKNIGHGLWKFDKNNKALMGNLIKAMKLEKFNES